MSIIIFLLGGALLYFGGSQIVIGSCAIARKFKIPTIVIGLTVVAMGTSMPELFISLLASAKGSSDIALGNVIGSNIFNIAFVLSFATFFMPLKAGKKSFNISMITMFILYLVLLISIFNINTTSSGLLSYFKGGRITPVEGIILIIILIFYIVYLYKVVSTDKDELKSIESDVLENEKEESIFLSYLRIIISIIFLALGSKFFIEGSVKIFSRFISEHVIGIAVVAVGTSIPEFVTSIIAAVKKEADISVGNIVGSNVFNVGAVLSISSISSFNKGGIILNPVQQYMPDFFVMTLTGIMLYLFMSKNKYLTKLQGIIFLIIYIIYTVFLVKTGSITS